MQKYIVNGTNYTLLLQNMTKIKNMWVQENGFG